MNGQATSPGTVVHAAAQGVTVVVTVGVDDARVRRSVSIQGLPPSADGAVEGVLTTTSRCAGHAIAYGFAADRPGTITYHVRYGFDPASAGLAGAQGVEAGGRARTDAGHGVRVPRSRARPSARRRARTDAGRSLVNVPRRDERPATADGIAVPLPHGCARGSGGVACVEAQLMAGCRVIYFNDKKYAGGPPFQRLLRWSGAALAAAAVWLSGICGRRDPDVRRRGDGDGPLNVRFGGRANPHVSLAPYFSPP